MKGKGEAVLSVATGAALAFAFATVLAFAVIGPKIVGADK